MQTPCVLPLLLAAEGGGGGFLSIDSTLLWATIVIFALFAFVLAKFAWGPLLKVVDEREKSIRDQVDSAERAAAEARDLLAKHEEPSAGPPGSARRSSPAQRRKPTPSGPSSSARPAQKPKPPWPAPASRSGASAIRRWPTCAPRSRTSPSRPPPAS